MKVDSKVSQCTWYPEFYQTDQNVSRASSGMQLILLKKVGLSMRPPYTKLERYPRSNGLAQHTVRTVTAMITKCTSSKQDLQKAMLLLRAGHHSLIKICHHLQKSYLENLYAHISPINSLLIFEKLQEKHEQMRKDHDKHAGPELPPLHEGQKVMFQDPTTKTW